MNTDINIIVHDIMHQNDKVKIDAFIVQYMPFILKVASEVKNAYIDAQNDEEVSIAMLAFHEAMTKFDNEKGSFLSFARIVISSRLKNYWQKEKRHYHEELDETIADTTPDNQYDLKIEINAFERELLKFGISFDDLSEQSPKHEDTRIRASKIGYLTANDSELMYLLYDRRRLPITRISQKFNYTIKIIKHSKTFITATALVYYNKFTLISEWIHKKDPKY